MGRQFTIQMQSAFNISLTIETCFRENMSHEVSLEIIRMNHNVLKLLPTKLALASTKNYAAMWRHNDQEQKKYDDAKSLSEKSVLYIEATGTSQYLSPPTATWSSHLMEPPTKDVLRLMLTISYSLYCRYYRLLTRRFQNLGKFTIHICNGGQSFMMEM